MNAKIVLSSKTEENPRRIEYRYHFFINGLIKNTYLGSSNNTVPVHLEVDEPVFSFKKDSLLRILPDTNIWVQRWNS